jgi:periplasmic protein TonB
VSFAFSGHRVVKAGHSIESCASRDGCLILVEPDAKARAGMRRRLFRAIAFSGLLEVLLLAAALLWPLFATGGGLLRAKLLTPIPPYGSHRRPFRPANGHRPVTAVGTTARRFLTVPVRSAPYGPTLSSSVEVPTDLPSSPYGRDDIGRGPAGLLDVPTSKPASVPAPPPAEKRHAPSATVRRSEGVQAALLINRVEPRYPPLALQVHAEGTVQLHAVIGRDGSMRSLEVISGNPLFIQSALDAVRQWRYRPTLLGGEAVEVETYITINFRLSR